MSYSYEVNVICDECNEAIAGEPCLTAFAAEYSASAVAKDKGWHLEFEGKWRCPDCYAEDAPTPPIL